MYGLARTGKRASHGDGGAVDRFLVAEPGPVFTDPSGKRHRILRRAGLTAAVLLVICLGAVVMAMSGGPQAPFTQWAAPLPPAAPATGQPSAQAARGALGPGARGGPSRDNPGAAHWPGLASPGGRPGSPPRAVSSPAPASLPSASASPSTSTPAVPLNPAGKTPPGRAKSPNPHKPSSAA